MAKHRKFNADRFLDKFQGQEVLLRNYAQLWKNGLDLDIPSLDVEGLKAFLADGEGVDKDAFMEGLFRVFDLCTEHGHEALKSACRDLNYDPDPNDKMTVEHLGLAVRTAREDVFNFAYDRCTLQQAERFSIYQGKKGQAITDLAAATEHLRQKLADQFKGDKNSDRVLVRPYQEDGYVNFIVYHEKRMQAVLTFKGSQKHSHVSPTVLRPAQQDFISYNTKTGQAEIEARFEVEEAALRKNFAGCCLGDENLFERPEAARRLDLAVIGASDFAPETDAGDTAALVELYFTIKQKHGPSFLVKSKDVLETLQLNSLRRKLSGGAIKRAVFKFTFPDDGRGKRIELSGTNKISFKRVKHADDVFRYLRKWKILRG